MSNKAKEVAIQSQQTEQSAIPFGKPARIGNFKIWKSKFELVSDPTEEQRKKVAEESGGKKKAIRQKVTIECINVSILDGSWMVRIPQTFEQFAMLSLAYSWSLSDDKDEQVKGTDYLRTAISNMYYVSCICNGFFHRGVEMVTSAYADPDLLKENERGAAFLKDAKLAIERFLEWRNGYDNLVSEGEPSDIELHQEEIAEEAMDILDGKEDK